MSEFINIIWEVIELIATILECIMITSFIVNMLGYKSPHHHYAKFIICTIASCINSIFISTLITLQSISAFNQILICFVFSIIFLRGNLFYKLFVSILSMFFILIINSVILSFMSNTFETPIYILISTSGTIRLTILALTKMIYFLITRFMIKLAKTYTIHLSKGESFYIITVFILTIIAGNIIFEVISSMKHFTVISIIAFIVLIFINIVNIMIIKKMHQINANKASIDRIAQELLKQNEKIDFLSQDCPKMNTTSNAINTEQINNFQNSNSKNYNDLRVVINNAMKECSEKHIILNCNISPYIQKFPENDIAALISSLLKESVIAYNKYEYKPYIDFEILNKNKYLSIIISHYIKGSNNKLIMEEKSKISIPFNPYRNKIISHILVKYNGIIQRNQNRDKIITNIWLDFSSASLINKK